ncbi:hypothetical protein SLY47_000707 [Salmonella enterica]|nr:hypothetical protein [Salmonella enterica]
MNITKCISFLRFTTIHPQFDLYLITNGIRNRPQDKGGIEYFDIPDGSVSLGFRIRSTYESESLLPIKSDGKFVFSELVVYQKNKDDLPYKLNFNDHLQFLREKLGKELKDNQNGLPERRVLTFFHDFLVIVIFMDSSENINLIKFISPDVFHRKK